MMDQRNARASQGFEPASAANTMALQVDYRARVRQMMKPPRRLKFTQTGRYFTGMTLLIGFGAINTGNNLLYLLLGMMLTLIVISGILSESVLQELKISRKFPNRIFANTPAPVEVIVENNKSRLPSFSIQVLDKIAGVHKSRSPAVYLMRLEPQEKLKTAYRFEFPWRGRWQIEGSELATRFPFDLFRKSRDIDAETEVLVYPQPIEPPNLQSLANLPFGDTSNSRPGHGVDFYGIRDYRLGDDIRDIHWKLSARRGELVSREYEEEQNRALTLCLINHWEPAPGADPRRYRMELEYAVATCAGTAQALLTQGFAVGLATLNARLEPGTGPGQFDRILHNLALLTFINDPDSGEDARPLRSRTFALGPRERSVLIGHADGMRGFDAGVVVAEIPCREAYLSGEDLSQPKEVARSKFVFWSKR